MSQGKEVVVAGNQMNRFEDTSFCFVFNWTLPYSLIESGLLLWEGHSFIH